MSEQSGSAEARASAAAHEYIRLTNEKRFDEFGELFADDAEFHAPNGEILHGKEAITAFYAVSLKREYVEPKLPMKPTAIALDGNQCLLAFQSKLDGVYEHCAVDQFSVDEDGKITRFIVYVRPGAYGDEIHEYWEARAAAGS